MTHLTAGTPRQKRLLAPLQAGLHAAAGEVRQMLRPPGFSGDDARTRAGVLLHYMFLVGLAATAICPLILFPWVPSLERMLIINSGVFVLGSGLLLLNKAGQSRAAGIGLMGLVVAAIVADSIYTTHSAVSPAAGILTFVVASAGFAFGYRGLLMSMLVCVLSMGAALLIRLGLNPDPLMQTELISQFSIFAVVLIVSGPGLAISVRFLTRTQQRERVSAEALASRNRELTELLAISQTISSTLDVSTLLDQLVDKLKVIVACDDILICEFVDGHHARVLNSLNATRQRHADRFLHRDLRADPAIDALIATRKPVMASGTNVDAACAMYVPLVVRDRVIGFMWMVSAQAAHSESGCVPISQAFATQAAVLIEMAGAHQEGINAAALEERQRIARGLHDSVSQALFGVVLGVRTAVQSLDAGADPRPALDYTLSLSEAALSEIRALVFEMRPEYLEKEGLIAAFTKQTEAMSLRHNMNVRISAQATEPDLPLATKEAVYRVGLEALQNTIKHSRATRVDVTIAMDGGKLVLEVKDNGCGFDAQADFAGHFGLKGMRERAAQVGAALLIDSHEHLGTRVVLSLPL